MVIPVEKVKKLVEKGTAVLTSPPVRIPSDTVTDAPLLGNGDIGVAIGGDGSKQVFYLTKNDFWSQGHLGETPEQHEQRLLTREMRRTGTRPVPAGYVEVSIEELKGCDYHAEQDPYLAEVRSEFRNEKAVVAYRSWVSATENTLVIEISNTGEVPLSLRYTTMPGMYTTSECYCYRDGIRDGSLCIEYPADYQWVEGRRWVYWTLSINRPAEYTPEKISGKGGYLTLPCGERMQLTLSMLSDLDGENPGEQAYEMSLYAREHTQELLESHRAWWREYWRKSIVETGNDTLDSFYYASLYIMGCSVRQGKVPPGIFGPWVTDDRPKWSGSYTLNYNYESPFFCLYTANRGELAESYLEPLLDIIPKGRMFARELFHRPGICLPVEIGPWGTICTNHFHHQKTNAAYCCCNIFMYFFKTLDLQWGRKAYPFVREVADFWEADLVWEPERNHYSVIGDSLHEEYLKEGGEKNNTHALGLVRMVFSGILRMSRYLEMDEERRERWQHILDHIADFPVYTRKGQKVFRYNEDPDSYDWKEPGNGSHIKFIYPFGCLGLDSDPELLEIGRNTVIQKDLFDNHNAFCEYTAMCARVGCDPQLMYDKLVEQCHLRGMANKYIWHGGGGIEDCGGVTEGIHEMMLQSHQGVLRVFPDWVPGVDASFTNLRAYGAFLVSANVEDDVVRQIYVESEKGEPLTIFLPWEKGSVKVNDGEAVTISGGKRTFATMPGDVLVFLPDVSGR